MKISKKTNKEKVKKTLRKARARKKIEGSTERPRLNIFKGSKALYAQVIDDGAQKTILGVATNTKDVTVKGSNIAAAQNLGKVVAEKCKAKNVTTVVFDRSGNQYHGVIKAFAESVREGGIKF